VGTLLQDARYAVRMLAKSPGFTAIAVLTLALAIGANTAIFSVVSPILFEPLPYPHASQIVMIWDIFQGSRSDVTFHTFRELSSRSYSFDAVSVVEPWRPTMTGSAAPERLEGQSVSKGYFRVIGISPSMGRDFEAGEEAFHGRKVVILSNGLWQRRFASDRGIIGHEITLDGDSYEVVGVMPRGFENVLAPSAEVWSAMQYDAGHITNLNTVEWGHHLRMLGRLRPGVSKENASRELRTIAGMPVAEFPRAPWAALKYGFIVESLQDEVTRNVKPALLAVFGAVLLVLAIASVNVTNLLLARGAQRRAEFAMRALLGARPVRMVRQALTESLLLSGIGGVFGVAAAQIGVRALLALAPTDLPRVGAVHLDRIVLAFGIAVTALLGVVVGLAPALYASRRDLQEGTQRTSQRTATGHQTTRHSLVVAEVSLAFVLLVSTGLLLRSLERVFAVDPGFHPLHVLTMQVQTSGHKFDTDGAKRQFFAKALEEVSHVPGVASAAFTSLLPLSEKREVLTAGTYGTSFEKDGQSYDVFLNAVTPDYFQTMGIPLRQGRFLDKRDVAAAAQAVLISESLAKREFPGEDPVGRRLHVGPIDRPWYAIVGVVGDVKQTALAVTDLDAVYLTPEQQWFEDDAMYLVVRTQGVALPLAPALRKAVWSADAEQAIVHVATMDSLVAASAAERRFVLILFEAFGLVALVLAATGIYGVLSGGVTERFREIGIRSALGASRVSILSLVMRQGMILVTLGSAIGLLAAAAISQAMIALLFGISRLDPITYCGAIALLAAVSAVACWAPAWRATKVDPMVVLRYE
jgi:putative ABC transport system permease protein